MRLVLVLATVASCGNGPVYKTHGMSVYCEDGADCWDQYIVDAAIDATLQQYGGKRAFEDLDLILTGRGLHVLNRPVGGYYEADEHRITLQTYSEDRCHPYGLVHEFLHAIQWKRDRIRDSKHLGAPWHLVQVTERDAFNRCAALRHQRENANPAE